MKPFKNIRSRLEICKLRHILILMCTSFCVIIGNILFSDVAFGGLLDGDNIYVEYEPAKSSLPHGRTSGDVIARLTGADIDSITVTSNGGLEHIFTQTGSFTFRYKNNNSINIITQSIEAKVDWIDKEPPTCGVVYSTKGEDYFGGCSHEQYDECIDGNRWNAIYTRLVNAFGRKTACIQQCSDNNIVEFAGQLTNDDVVATLTGCSEEIIVTNNNGNPVYTYNENGNFVFEFQDLAGNPGYLYTKVNGIDIILPECEVEYSTKSPTSGNVVATLTGCNKTLEDTPTSYEFTGNGSHTFILKDTEGNTGEAKAKVSWIDKEKPVCSIVYNPNISTTGDVLAILTGCNEKIANSETMFLFVDNGSYLFKYQDLVGNTGEKLASVDWILPDNALTGLTHIINDGIITLNWETIAGYNGNVDFYLWYEDSKQYSLLGTAGLESKSFNFEAQREGWHMIKIVPENGGNIKYYSIPYENTHPTITPTCEIEYPDPDKHPTNQDVIVKLTNCNEKVYVTNTDGGNIFHTFSDKGTFTFEFRDDYGNTGETTANVDWIDKIPPICEVDYSNRDTTTEPVIATVNTDSCTESIHFENGYESNYTFTQNGKHIFYFLDNVGNIGTAEANVSWITGNNEIELSYAITGINHIESEGDIILTWDVINGRYIDILFSYNGNEYTYLDNDINVDDQRYSFKSIGTGNYSIKFVPQNNLLVSEYTFDIRDDNENNGNNDGGDGGDGYEEVVCQIIYSPSSPTSGNVVATLTGCNRKISIESFTHTFTGDGTYIFNYEDTDGNPGQKIAKVDWIDKIPPKCNISYSTTHTTNHNVNATISCDDENIIIKNNNHTDTHVFTGNGEFIFEVSDLVGNSVSLLAEVSCIDKQAPTCDIAYSTRQQTTGEVFATLTNCSEQVISVPGYSLYHRFLSNGSYSIIFGDMAGNLGSARAEVDWIIVDNGNDDNTDETGAAATSLYPITGVNHFIYNGEIKLTWTALTSGYMDISIIKNDMNLRVGTVHTYSELFSIEPISSYRVSFTPLDSNLQTVYYDIDIPDDPDDPVEPDPIEPVNPDPINPDPITPGEPEDPIPPINHDIPTCNVSYSTEQETHEAVIATLYDCSQEVTPLAGYSFFHVFNDNGSFMFYFIDNNGNIGTTRASVNWITHGDNNEQSVNYMLTGVSHSITGNKIRLTWTALSPGAVEIYLWDSHTKEYKKIGSTNINYEEFLIDITRSGEYLFRLNPIDGDATIYFIYVDTYTGIPEIYDCEIKYDYIHNSVVAILTGCDASISIINNGGSARHVFDDNENMFTFEIKDSEGNIGNISAYTWYSENFDHYNDNLSWNNHIMLGNPPNNTINNYLLFYSDIPFKGSFSITGNHILLDNGAIFENSVTCALYTGNNLTINIDGLGSKSVHDIVVPGKYAGFMSYELPKSYYTNNIFVNFELNIKTIGGGFCLIDDVSIVSKPNNVVSTKKIGAKTGTYYKSHNIKISGLPENTAIPISVNIDYTDTIIKNYGKCINDDVLNINYCEGKYITDIILYKNGEIVPGGETVGQNGDIFTIKIKSSIYDDSKITANLMFGHTKKSIISQFSVSTFSEDNMHGSADFEYNYSSFDPNYEFEWNEAYQYSYSYGLTTQPTITRADMYGNLNRIAMAKMLSKYATNILGYKIDNDKECKFSDVTNARDQIYDNGATNACKLGIMGVNMPNNEFRPYDLVTRAEFATALSRLLYGTKDGKDLYYSTHIAKLKAENIITDTNPNLIEKRGYVMLMLMRSGLY